MPISDLEKDDVIRETTHLLIRFLVSVFKSDCRKVPNSPCKISEIRVESVEPEKKLSQHSNQKNRTTLMYQPTPILIRFLVPVISSDSRKYLNLNLNYAFFSEFCHFAANRVLLQTGFCLVPCSTILM